MLALALVLASVIAPTPAPSPTPALKEIVHVHASAACAELATHTNSAIGAALVNDATLPQMITTLRAVHLDSNPLDRHKGLASLGKYAEELTEQAIAGDREVKMLRALAERSPNPDRKKNLTKFANALGGAIWRQHKIARDLNGFIAAMDYEDMAKPAEAQIQSNEALFGSPESRSVSPGDAALELHYAQRQLNGDDRELSWQREGVTDDVMAARAATDFDSRLPAISSDEGTAADFLPAATSGC